jgi:glycosyltransferase involved in cell wall biosynthesis
MSTISTAEVLVNGRRARNAKSLPVVLHTRVVTGTGGGPEKTILNSPRFLTPYYRTLCAYMHPPGDPGFEQLREKAKKCQAPLLSVYDRGPFDLSVFWQYLRICREEQVAIWHGHDYKSNLIGLFLRPFYPMRLITTVHGWVRFVPPKTTFYYALDRRMLPHYEKIICVSNDLHEYCLSLGIARENCLLIENAIDTEVYARKTSLAAAKTRLGFPSNRLLVGAVGRLSKEKGFDVLIRSVHQLIKRGMPVSLFIVGEGDQRQYLQALIGELACQEHIRLLGYVADPSEYYEALDVYALSSYMEGLPNVLLEAMAMEVPIVSTRVAGIPNLITNEQCGLLIKPGSVEELAQALSRLLSDPALRARFREAGRRTVETRFSFEIRMRKVRAVYDDLLGLS